MSLNVDVAMEKDALLGLVLDEVDRQRRQRATIKVFRFGFLRLPFTATRLEEGNSLHLWLPGELPADEAPHIHNCRLASRVLMGSLTNVEWTDPVPSPEGKHRRVQTICTDTVCQDVGSEIVQVEEQARQIFGEGGAADYYQVPQGQFHSTEFDEPVLTVIRKTNFVTDPNMPIPNILPLDATPKTEPFDITNFDQQKAWAMLDSALAQL